MDITDFNVTSIKETLKEGKVAENSLRILLSNFSCPQNHDVERFFREQSIDFTKRKQSVSYLVSSKADDELLAYFTLAIKAISVNADHFSNTIRKRIERVSEVNEQTG